MAIPKEDGWGDKEREGPGERGTGGGGTHESVNHEMADKATGARGGASLTERATGGEDDGFHLLDRDLRGNPRTKESPWGLLDKNLDGSPKENERAFRLADKGTLDLPRPDFRDLYDYRKDPYTRVRCSEFANPGQIAFIFGNDPDQARSLIFKGDVAMTEILAKMGELALAAAFGPELALMTETERLIYDQVAGSYSGAQMEKLMHASGYEPGPGRCFVHQPDRPDTWWFRELK